MNCRAQVKGYAGEEELGAALAGADLVIIPAGVPRKPGMTRDDLFNINASIVKSIVQAVGKVRVVAIWSERNRKGRVKV